MKIEVLEIEGSRFRLRVNKCCHMEIEVIERHGKFTHMIQPYAYPGTFRDIPVSAPRKPASGVEQKNPDYLIQPEDIIALIAEHYRMKTAHLKKTRSRKREPVKARYMCFRFIRKYTPLSLRQTGKLFGGYHYATVIHGLETIDNAIDTDEKAAFEAKHIEAMIERSIKTLNHPA